MTQIFSRTFSAVGHVDVMLKENGTGETNAEWNIEILIDQSINDKLLCLIWKWKTQ